MKRNPRFTKRNYNIMASVVVENLTKEFGSVKAVDDINLKVNDGEFLVLVGPSGCGKSTLLRMIGGLEDTSMGDILIDGQVVTNFPPSKRGLSMVFQSYALYPHLTVEENMGFPLKTAGEKKNVIKNRVDKVAKVLKLENYSNRLPKTLSGGQRQRVAIGRSIVRNPTAFLFDEPLSNLDAALRVDMRLELAKLHQELKATMIYVTHDQVEAMTLADRIVILNLGNIEQVGTPTALYHNPLNLFVARFIGTPAMNILPCSLEVPGVSSSSVQISSKSIEMQFDTVSDQSGAEINLGVRPEHFIVSNRKDALIAGKVEIVEALGEFTIIYVDCGFQTPIIAKLIGDLKSCFWGFVCIANREYVCHG